MCVVRRETGCLYENVKGHVEKERPENERAMIGENRQLVTDEPVEFEK